MAWVSQDAERYVGFRKGFGMGERISKGSDRVWVGRMIFAWDLIGKGRSICGGEAALVIYST